MAKAKSKALATTAANDSKLIVGDRVFDVVKQVTLPLLRHADHEFVSIRITSAIYESKPIEGGKGAPKKDPKEKPAELVRAVNLMTGRPCQYIIAAVVKGNLEQEYPGESYVGKCFTIHKLPAATGKRYKQYEIVEIEDNGETV